MKIKKLNEHGYAIALQGIALSYNKPDVDLRKIAKKLARRNGGHNKFLESIVVWLDITAPRYFWQQFDSYRVGITKQSESTMHTLLKRELMLEDFEAIDPVILKRVNMYIEKKNLEMAKKLLPESFLQRRIVCTNYKTLYTMYMQRRKHKLSEWRRFCIFLEIDLSLWREFFDE
uniref:Uncharacterized protein n=1 Tax=viral metagenome TaxID=1070528 RepID=A0A6H1ZN30_9ZZZZ